MAIDLRSDKKIEVLLHLLDENRKQVIWVKNLDFKMAYYSLGFFVAATAWFSANPPQSEQIRLLQVFVAVSALLSWSFLWRNHSRHDGLNREFNVILDALRLTEANVYAEKPICPIQTRVDWRFHFGRGLYALFVGVGAVATCAFLRLVASP